MTRHLTVLAIALCLLLAAPDLRAEDASAEAAPTNWSLGAAIGGLAIGAVSLSLGLVGMNGIDADNESGAQGYGGLGLAMTAASAGITAISGPIVWLGSRSARRLDPSIRGVPELRALGWVLYAVQIGFMTAVTGVAASGERVEGWLAAVGGAVGILSLNAFAIDAMLAYSQSRNLAHADDEARRPSSRSFAAAPVVAPRGEDGLVVGVAAAF